MKTDCLKVYMYINSPPTACVALKKPSINTFALRCGQRTSCTIKFVSSMLQEYKQVSELLRMSCQHSKLFQYGGKRSIFLVHFQNKTKMCLQIVSPLIKQTKKRQFKYAAYSPVVLAQKFRKNDKHNLRKSIRLCRHGTPRSLGTKSCGGWTNVNNQRRNSTIRRTILLRVR